MYLYNREKNSKGSNYPSYIYKELNNIESNKRAFRKKAEKYEIDPNGYLCYKMKDKNDLYNEIDDNLDFVDNKITNLNKQNNLSDYSLYVIQYKTNEFELIKNIHERNNFKIN